MAEDLRITSPSAGVPPAGGSKPVSPAGQGKGSVQGSGVKTTGTTDARTAVSADQGVAQPLESLLPIAVLKSEKLLQVEWAWRRLLLETVTSSRSAAQTGTTGQTEAQAARLEPSVAQTADGHLVPQQPAPSQPPAGPVSSSSQIPPSQTPAVPALPAEVSVGEYQGVQRLWNAMEQLSGTASSPDVWSTQLTLADNLGPVVPFVHLSPQHFAGEIPENVKDWMLADRLAGAVHTAERLMSGEGLFFPQLPVPDTPSMAVRWQADRHSRLGVGGHMVHRLNLRVQLGNDPVEIRMIYSASVLQVHFATDNASLGQSLATGQPDLQQALKQVGVSVNQVTTGPYEPSNKDGNGLVHGEEFA
ncbi:flagellar hook-length control protein FliK [Alicyclobacillus tolerans]|uniref:flagellar hook-length control protein FliK n=1 Tax=Alicyclobacillus tolerans TaxID=90970 RepID=UPI001F20F200|nr:flagellar hook-length control protein FliK [Alicyclobacillus tolerans]MCF8564735.1 flagellar hook-length control protein FliK [Alicyclobacillus tolerans]